MNKEEKKAIGDFKGKEISFKIDWTPEQKRTFEKVTGFNDFRNDCITAETLINLIEKQQEQLQEKDKVIDLLASEIVEFTGSCPLDTYDYEGIDCENKCDTGIEKQCFIEYFTKKAREV